MALVENPASPLPQKLKGVHLFHFDGAPCAQRVRFALAEKGLVRGPEVRFNDDSPQACEAAPGTWTSRQVSLIKKEHLTPEYAQIQPNLVVPALVHDGRLYIESMDIVSYIDNAFAGPKLIPDDEARRAHSESLVEAGESLHRSIRFVSFRWGLGRLGQLNRKEEARLKELVSMASDEEKLVEFYSGYDAGSIAESVYLDHLKKLHDAFSGLNDSFADGRAFLTGDSLSMADVIWAMKLLRLTECGYPFASEHPALYQWFEQVQARPAFQSGVMGKHRLFNRVFKIKAATEKLFGGGLAKALAQVA